MASATAGSVMLSRMGLLDQVGQVVGHVVRIDLRRPWQTQVHPAAAQEATDAPVQFGAAVQHAAAEADANDRVALRPVPAGVGGESLEQRPVAFEQLLEGVHQQALAEAAGRLRKNALPDDSIRSIAMPVLST
jgi:hypothetical protein